MSTSSLARQAAYQATPLPSDERLEGKGETVEDVELEALEAGDIATHRLSTLSSTPFALRTGHCLEFAHINMKLEKKKATKVILNEVYGKAEAGSVTAILGTSGSGKTSLLNVLSGRMTNSTAKHLSVHADIKLDEKPVDPSNIIVRQAIAFVAQEDSLQITATPREAIRFSAKLRLSASTSEKELQEITETMLNELHLQDCADTIVGSPLVKGLSGGERKRTSVGVELVTQPSLVFLDEATSGLDSFNALELVNVLKRVAEAGCAVLMTIHQPSSDIFTALDALMLLRNGRVLYTGTRERTIGYFAERGFPCPHHYNPADWILTISQTIDEKQLTEAGFFDEQPPSLELQQSSLSVKERKQQQRESIHSIMRHKTVKKVGPLVQTRLLFQRELRNLRRNKKAIKARVGMTTVISLLGGIIFYQVGNSDVTVFINIQSTFGGLLLAFLANVFATALPSLVTFPEERPVMLREYSTNHYGIAPYFASRLCMELFVTGCQVTLSSVLTFFLMALDAPFGIFWATCYTVAMTSTALAVALGSGVKDPTVAVEFLPLLFMPQILFAGFFVPPDLIPIWLRWLAYVFPLTYAVKIGVVAQFNGTCGDAIPNLCDMVMDNVKANPDDTWWYWLVLVGQFVFFRLLALLLLQRKAQSFY